MSDYVRQKVLRIPISEKDKTEILKQYQADNLWDLEFKIDNFDYAKVGKFQHSPTVKEFIDYVLEYSYDEDYGEWGKVRELTDNEKTKYEPIFHKLYEGFDINKIRLVEFCWYDCTEAPDYYELKTDEFYNEV